jgi:hypothetical protein
MNRYFILAMIFPSMLAGCVTPAVTATLTTTPPAAEEEIRGGMAPGSKGVVVNNKPAQGGRADGATAGRDTNNQTAGQGAGNTNSGTAAATASNGPVSAPNSGDTEAAGQAASATDEPFLDIQAWPTENFGIIPIMTAADTVADLQFSSTEPVAEWRVAYAGGKAVTISKVKLTYRGEGDPWVVDLAPSEMNWPTTIGSGAVPLRLGLDIGATFAFFEEQPMPGERLTIEVQLLDGLGNPLKDETGDEVTLVLPVSVL